MKIRIKAKAKQVKAEFTPTLRQSFKILDSCFDYCRRRTEKEGESQTHAAFYATYCYIVAQNIAYIYLAALWQY